MVMDEPILCITVLFFLGWVIYLKLQTAELKREIEKLREALKLKVRKATQDAEVSEDDKVFGHKPGWMK